MSASPLGSSRVERRDRDSTSRLRIVGIDTLSIDWGATTELIPWHDVIAARSVGNYTEILTVVRTLKVHCPLRAVVELLDQLGLVQLRRECAVNGARVRRLIGGGRHRLLVVLDEGTCVRVGRQFQSEIRARFGAPT